MVNHEHSHKAGFDHGLLHHHKAESSSHPEGESPQKHHHYLVHSFAGVMFAIAMIGVAAPAPAAQPAGRVEEEAIVRGEDEFESPEVPDEDEEPPLDLDTLVNAFGPHYGVDTYIVTSADALAQWEAGLTDAETHPEFVQLLQSVGAAAARDAGVTPQSLDDHSLAALNGIGMASLTPEQARQMVAGEGPVPAAWEHLVQVARAAGKAAGDVAALPAAEVTGEQGATTDVLVEMANTQHELAELLKQSLEQKGEPESDWGKVVDLLKPTALASGLIGAFVEAWNRGAVDWVKHRLRGSGSEKAIDRARGVASDTVSGDTYQIVTVSIGEGIPAAIRSAVSEPVEVTEQQAHHVRYLGFFHDAYLEPAELIRVRAGSAMAESLREAGAPAPEAIAAAVSSGCERVVDRSV